jgi:tRNA (guanine26-N2/guanine27-N2)-dimethyltransferase
MFKEIQEGKTRLLVPIKESPLVEKPPVFYNPRMKLNRDICCSVVKVLMKKEDITFADLLAGTGAKGIRVANETGCKVHLNDANTEAYHLILKNAKLNNLRVYISNKEANLFLHEKGRFEFIDIDPFGTPVPFLDAAVMRVKRTGYLGVTATDTAPLCGVYPKTCYRKYGAIPIRSEFCHEIGLRILLGYIAKTAAKYGRGINCLISHSTDHYFRIYVQLSEGNTIAKKALENLGYVYYCRKCKIREYEKGVFPSSKKCNCDRSYEVGGPLWLGKIKDQKFSSAVLKESEYLNDRRLHNLLTLICEEVEIPFYYDIHKLCKSLKRSAPPIDKIISKLRSKGYIASRTHFSPTSIKTDAPIEELNFILL